VTAGEPNEKKENINGGGGDSTGGSKNGDIKGGTKKGTSGKTSRGLLLRKKKGFIILFFLKRLRFRPFLPRL